MGKLNVEELKVGDILYAKISNHYHFAPRYQISTIKKITPKGKIRLDSGTLIDPEWTHLRKLTSEVLLEENEWFIKELLVNTFTALEGGSKEVIKKLSLDEVNGLMQSLIPLLKNLQNYESKNGYLANSYSNSVPTRYEELIKERVDIINLIIDKREKDNENI